MPQRAIKKLRDRLRRPRAQEDTARERYIAKTGKKGQKGPLARMLEKSRTGKPSPHVDPKRKKRMTADEMRKFIRKAPGYGKNVIKTKREKPMIISTGGTVTKGPNTPGEKMRRIKGGLTRGKIRTKKMLAGDFDKGKKIRYQRRGK